MSAYMCDPSMFIMLAIQDRRARRLTGISLEDLTTVARVLCEANIASLRARYRDPDGLIGDIRPETIEVTFADFDRWHALDPIQVIKSAQCFAYQACEVDNWEATTAFKISQRVIGDAIARLPGYEGAIWGIPA